MLDDVFRVQCIFPNMESMGIINEKNINKIGKKI